MYIIVFVTAGSIKEAKIIAKALLKEKLAACVNIIGKIKSMFWWKAKIDSSDECLLVIKSKKEKLNKITKLVKSLHSYQTPEIIALPIVGGENSYLRWIDESLG